MSRRAIVFMSLVDVHRALSLPEGLHVVACRDDFLRDGVAVLVEGDALDDQPENIELPRLPATLLDAPALALKAEVSGWDRDNGANLIVTCPEPCSWTREWDHYGVTLAMAADAVRQHIAEAHAAP